MSAKEQSKSSVGFVIVLALLILAGLFVAYGLSAGATDSDVTVTVSDKRLGHDTFAVESVEGETFMTVGGGPADYSLYRRLDEGAQYTCTASGTSLPIPVIGKMRSLTIRSRETCHERPSMTGLMQGEVTI